MRIEASERPFFSKLHLRLCVVVLAITSSFSIPTKAQGTDDLVEVRKPDDAFSSYHDRRPNHGWLLGLKTENYRPMEWVSLMDSETYENVFGKSDIPFFGIEAGYKQNLGPLSIGFLLGWASGKIDDNRSGLSRELRIDKTTLRLMAVIDNVMDEPYVAPYFSLGAFQFGGDENIPSLDLKFSGQTKIGTFYSFGLLLQLNWLEKDVSARARLGSGLENTYLDIFMASYAKTSGEDDPDTSSSLNWGAGLMIEF